MVLSSSCNNRQMAEQEVTHLKNQAIRKAALVKGVRLWQVAEALGVHENTLSRRLRTELPQEEQERILSIINELGKEEG